MWNIVNHKTGRSCEENLFFREWIHVSVHRNIAARAVLNKAEQNEAWIACFVSSFFSHSRQEQNKFQYDRNAKTQIVCICFKPNQTTSNVDYLLLWSSTGFYACVKTRHILLRTSSSAQLVLGCVCLCVCEGAWDGGKTDKERQVWIQGY